MKAIKKQVEIEFFTFEEIVEFGKQANPDSIHGDRAWSFEFKGHNITHENDECYIIPTLEGNHNFTPDDVLIVGVKGEIYPCKKDIFEMTYNINNEPNSPKNREVLNLFEDRILVKRDEAEKKTKAGIIIPDSIVEAPARGIVVQVGPGRDSTTQMPSLGDTVLFSKHAGTEIKLNDTEYLLMRSTDIFGVIKTE